MSFQYSKKLFGCPISCRYCVITKVDSRRRMWNKKTLVGMNRAVTIINPPPDKTDKKAMADFYDFPFELLRGDIVGFNAISDPFWPKYQEELFYFLERVAPLAKLVVAVTKFTISDDVMKKLAKISNFRLNVSITGLDNIENTKTEDRLRVLRKAKKYGVKAFPIIHPYIAGMSDLSFLPLLKKIGYDEIDVKGLRYNHETMSAWMPLKSQAYYLGSEESEVLPEDSWRDQLKKAGMKLRPLKDWHRDGVDAGPRVDHETAKKNTAKLAMLANITSSKSNEEVIEASIRRKM